MAERIFVDAPNVDGVLGYQILGRKPAPSERPRWDRLLNFFRPAHGVFVLDQRHFSDSKFPLRRVLRTMGWQVQVARDTLPENDDPVDCFILRALRSLPNDEATVAVVSHDHAYADALKALICVGSHVVICCFREECAPALLDLESRGAEILDLEHDLNLFAVRLPRPTLPLYTY